MDPFSVNRAPWRGYHARHADGFGIMSLFDVNLYAHLGGGIPHHSFGRVTTFAPRTVEAAITARDGFCRMGG